MAGCQEHTKSERELSPAQRSQRQRSPAHRISPSSQRSPGQRSQHTPFNRDSRRGLPDVRMVPVIEDRSRSASSGNSGTSESDCSQSSSCESECDCMLCFRREGTRKTNRRSAKGRKNGVYNGHEGLDKLLKDIPLPFVKIWKFLSSQRAQERPPSLLSLSSSSSEEDANSSTVIDYLRIMQGYIKKIEAALNFTVPREYIVTQLLDFVRKKSKELDAGVRYFDEIHTPVHEQDPNTGRNFLWENFSYRVPKSIIRYAINEKGKTAKNNLPFVISGMMMEQLKKDYLHGIAPERLKEYHKVQDQYIRHYTTQIENYVHNHKAANKGMKSVIKLLQSCCPDLLPGVTQQPSLTQQPILPKQQSPEQKRSPWKQRSLGQRQRRQRNSPWKSTPRSQSESDMSTHYFSNACPPDWHTKIPELPVEFRYMLAMVQEYEKNEDFRVPAGNSTDYKMGKFRKIIHVYCVRMLRELYQLSWEDIKQEEGEINKCTLNLQSKAINANELDTENGVNWRDKVAELDILQSIPFCILELHSFMIESCYDYSNLLQHLVVGLMAEAFNAIEGHYPSEKAQADLERFYVLQLQDADKAMRRRTTD